VMVGLWSGGERRVEVGWEVERQMGDVVHG
jgi:hypothetical protein